MGHYSRLFAFFALVGVSHHLPILEQTYNFTLDLYRLVGNFPKAHKFILGNKIVSLGNDILENLTEASHLKGEIKSEKLNNADISLKKLLVFIRFSKDLSFISFKQYESFSKKAVEIGKQIGGWKKWQEKTTSAEFTKAEERAQPYQKMNGAEQNRKVNYGEGVSLITETAKGVTFNLGSPIIKQYIDAKQNHPDKIIAIKCGNFYKVFFNDAHFFQKTFGFKLRDLTAKNCNQKIESCGFPVSSAEKYQGKIKNLLLLNEKSTEG